MPPKRTYVVIARAVAAAARVAAAAPMTVAAVEKLIEARVSEALAIHETLRNSTNGHGDGSHNSGTGLEELHALRESDKVKKYVGRLPEMIRGNVMSYQPKTMEKAIEFANDQMD
ncbi:hypothetical protein Tco_1382301 [Tanacetum coccineum]